MFIIVSCSLLVNQFIMWAINCLTKGSWSCVPKCLVWKVPFSWLPLSCCNTGRSSIFRLGSQYRTEPVAFMLLYFQIPDEQVDCISPAATGSDNVLHLFCPSFLPSGWTWMSLGLEQVAMYFVLSLWVTESSFPVLLLRSLSPRTLCVWSGLVFLSVWRSLAARRIPAGPIHPFWPPVTSPSLLGGSKIVGFISSVPAVKVLQSWFTFYRKFLIPVTNMQPILNYRAGFDKLIKKQLAQLSALFFSGQTNH